MWHIGIYVKIPTLLKYAIKDNPVLNNNIENLPDEIWLPIPNYENLYWISNQGRVRNNRKVMKTYRINSGYLCIDLTNNKVKKKYLLHRLVATTFLCNLNNHKEVNHIDECKDNNSVNNLEWCSSSYNKQHSIATGTYNALYTTKNSLGKKHIPNTLSKYHNVTYDKNRGKWSAGIRHQGKNIEFKRFTTEIEAALHVNYIIDKYQLTDRPKNIIETPND